MNIREEGSILENTAAGDEFPQTTGIHLPQLRTHCQNGVAFRGEVECLLRFVIVDPMHPITVVKERRYSANSIDQQPMKSSVQVSGKCRILFVHMDKVGRATQLDAVSSLS